jgi:predicted dehydrogenase
MNEGQNSDKKIKIGVIGVGNMGKNHVRVIKSLPEQYELVAVFDRDAATVSQLGLSDIAAPTAQDLFEKADAVAIAAPSSLHTALAIEAAGNGLHALVEKPLALSSAGARQIVDAFERSGTKLLVGHVERYNPVITELSKILVHENIIGVQIERCSPKDLRISDTDVVFDLMIHDIDILQGTVAGGEPLTLLSAGGEKVYSADNIDYAQAMLRSGGGAILSVLSSRATEDKIRKMHVHCVDCYIEIDLLIRSITISRKTNYALDIGYDPTYSQQSVTERVFITNEEPLRREFLHFADCINKDAAPLTDGGSALSSIGVLESIRSMIYRDGGDGVL